MPQFGKQSWAAGHVTQAWMREREIRRTSCLPQRTTSSRREEIAPREQLQTEEEGGRRTASAWLVFELLIISRIISSD
jgi:hypothetical protein